MYRLIPFDEYKKLVEMGKQRAQNLNTGISCPECKNKELFLKQDTIRDIHCPCCKWEGQLPI